MVKTLAVAALVAACGDGGDGGEFPQGDGHDGLGAINQGTESQGTRLLGQGIDPLYKNQDNHANVLADAVDADGNPITVEVTGAGSLKSGTHVGIDPFFTGVTFHDDAGAEVQIEVSRGGSDVAWYRLKTRATPSDPWVDPCLIDMVEHDDAVPYAGTWSRTGTHALTPGRITFACSGGVAYKCIKWRFLPNGDATSLAFRANQACTRMARADYCADGRSHTRVGTKIKIFDLSGVVGPPTLADLAGIKDYPPAQGKFFFEAAWNDGAKPAACLSRLRWQSIPLDGDLDGDGAACPNAVLPDPRTNAARFCDDETFDGSLDGPLVFNASQYADLEAHVWTTGTDAASTVRGYYEPTGVTKVPFPQAPVTFTHVSADAMMLREIPDSVDINDLVELRLYSNGTDTYVAELTNPPAGYSDLGAEGYIYRFNPLPAKDTFTSYDLLTNDTDFISTTLSHPGYHKVRTIGFTLKAELKNPPDPDL